MKKKYFLVPIFILLAGTAWYYFTSQKTVQPQKIDMNDIVVVSTGSIENRIDVVAKVSLENKESLTFKQTGKVTKVLVKEGQKVAQGEVLAMLDTKELDMSIASSKIQLDNAQLSLKKLTDGPTSVEVLSSENKVSDAERRIDTLIADLTTLKSDKQAYISNQNTSINENYANIAVTEKKIENLSVDVELAKKQLETSIEEIKATGDSRLRTTYSNLQSALLDLRDAQSFYKKLLSIENANDPNFLLLGNSQLRSDAVFGYTVIVKNISELDKMIAQFDPKNSSLEEAKNVANALIVIMKSSIDYNAKIKVLLEETLVGGYYSDSLLNSYKSSVSGYASKFTSASNSASSNIRELSSGNSVETTELSTKASLLSKESSYSSMKLELQKIKNTDATLRLDMEKKTAEYDLKMRLKEAEIEAARASLELVKKEHADLLDGADLLDIEQSRNSVKQAENTYNTNLRKKDDYRIIAPMDGTIASLSLKERFEAPTSTAIVIENRDTISLKVLLDQSQVVKISNGATAKVFFDAYKKQGYDATVSFVESVPVESSGVVSYTVKLTMKRPEGVELFDSMTATAQIYLDSVNDAIRVPLAAVQEDTNGKFVQVYDGKRLRKQSVTVGKTDTSYAQILTGLSAGESVSITSYAITSAQATSNPFQSLFGGQRRSGAQGSGSQGSTRQGGSASQGSSSNTSGGQTGNGIGGAGGPPPAGP